MVAIVLNLTFDRRQAAGGGGRRRGSEASHRAKVRFRTTREEGTEREKEQDFALA